MIAYVADRWSRSSWWCRRVALFALLVMLVAVAAHWFAFIDTPAFLAVLGVVLGLALLALILAAAGFQRVWYLGDRGGRDLTFGILVAGLVLVPFAVAAYRAVIYPPLVDISTDLDDPPQMQAAVALHAPGMNAVAPPTEAQKALQAKSYPEITGRRYNVSVEQIAAAVELLMEQRDWEVVPSAPAEEIAEYSFEGVARLPILALPYDISVRLTDEGNATYVDMRSIARYGARDLGVNAALILSFLQELDTQAAALAGVVVPEE